MISVNDNEKYQTMTHKEHILKVPDTYIGSIEPSILENIWICNDKFIQKDIKVSVGFMNACIGEIIANSIDQCTRTRDYIKKDKTVQLTKIIKINIDRKTGYISVYNDGDGIPVKEQKDKGKMIYIPELIFGKLLSSSNYDKTKKKKTGGKNGYGAKLCNVYSLYFKVITVDHRRKLKFTQIWENNMSEPKNKPKITKYTGEPYTEITFLPDYKRFGMDKHFSDDVLSFIRKRAYDISGCTSSDVNVYFNDKKIKTNTFESYVRMYLPDKKIKRIYFKTEFWEVVACASNNGNFKQVSLVNGICTTNGGKHVDYISKQICRKLAKKINGNSKTGLVKANHIKNNLWVFINCYINNPSFSSQTKEFLTTPSSKFGSKCDISKDFIDQLYKTEITERAKLLKSLHDKTGLNKTDGKKTKSIRGIPKLEDANWAGTKKSTQCTLILTEGDSAKALVVSALGVIGRDRFGVFPLKGKLLNVKTASDKKISSNKEILALKKIIGLKQDTKSVDELRYGKVMILCDQDKDGLHIKGLVMNMFSYYWEDLLHSDFLVTIYTPIVKVFKRNKVIRTFYVQHNYDKWLLKQKDTVGLKIKYYKGLGTSTKKEAQEYFSEYPNNIINYTWSDESKRSLDLAFSKDDVPGRKEWLSFFNPNNVIDPTNNNVSFTEFVDKELIHFSDYDNKRSIPSFCDGLKPSQRKVLCTFFRKNIIKERKVSDLSGYITIETAYHHGESSLEGTVIKMSQNFVGSNNVNFFHPAGQFGTRLQGGEDHAQSRYIFTYLEKYTRYIFKKEDEPLLTFIEEEGTIIEPKWYLPIIPMILVNGTHGIGTGFSTHVPCFNPKSIINKLINILDGKQIKKLKPWYKNFKGIIYKKECKKTSKWITSGKINYLSYTEVEITELPIGLWTNYYHEYLESLVYNKSEKNESLRNKQCIVNYTKCNNHDDENIHLIVTFKKEVLDELKSNFEKLKSVLKIEESKSCSMTNMHLFDPLGEIVKFKTPESILISFYKIRLYFYKRRKKYQIKFIEREIKFLGEKIRFIKGIIDKKINIQNKSEAEILLELRNKYFFLPNPMNNEIIISPVNKRIYENALKGEVIRYYNNVVESDSSSSESSSESDVSSSDDEKECKHLQDRLCNYCNFIPKCGDHKNDCLICKQSRTIIEKDYGYLINMPIYTLTKKKLSKLVTSLEIENKKLQTIKIITPKQLWKNDLIDLKKFLK